MKKILLTLFLVTFSFFALLAQTSNLCDIKPQYKDNDFKSLFVNMPIGVPIAYRINELQGNVKCVFKVNKSGKISDIEITETHSGGLGEEIKKYLLQIGKMTPAKLNGQKVDHVLSVTIPYDYMPEEATRSARFKGGNLRYLQSYVDVNVKRSKEAEEAKAFGRLQVEFGVTKGGEVEDVKIISSENDLLNDSTLEFIKGLGKFEPAIRDGEPIDSKIKLLVTFVPGLDHLVEPQMNGVIFSTVLNDGGFFAPLFYGTNPERLTFPIILEITIFNTGRVIVDCPRISGIGYNQFNDIISRGLWRVGTYVGTPISVKYTVEFETHTYSTKVEVVDNPKEKDKK